uniref:FAS1 domain-containing protein n=1 Tax=Cannabis sativa TaxID=3483 RepID=A0A803QCR9_CANSA
MQLRPALTAGTLVLAMAVIFIFSGTGVDAHNITKILAKHPEFSSFNHYLTLTHLASEINQRTTITVCAVDNAAMGDILSKHPNIYTVKNILSIHVLLDYFGAKKLHQITNGTALAATMFQATGSAPGSTGFVNITDLHGGKVGFAPEDNNGAFAAHFVKSVEEIPYNISVIQISAFSDALLANDAMEIYEDALAGGLTLFCPLDDAFKAFLPKFKNLTKSGKNSLLEYHGVPVYQSMSMLKSNNGLMNTLATDGASKFDFTVQNDGEQVTLKTKLVTAKITGTLIDEQPVVIYTIDKVLMPKELFKHEKAETPAPAPAPEKAADAPKSSKKKGKKAAPSPDDDADADAPAPDDDDVADQTADDNGAVRFDGNRFSFFALIATAWLGFSVL